MRRRIVAGVVAGLVLLPAGAAVAQPRGGYAPTQEIPREPLIGICIRPLIGEGGILNLPLIDIPGKRIPNESLEATLGGQYRNCK